MRSFLTILGITIGIASVILLTSIGEGVRHYLVSEFTQFGTRLLAVMPGHSETSGLPGVVGGTIQHLTIDDAEALERIPGIEAVVPLAFGSGRVESDRAGRSVFIYGVSSDAPRVWGFGVRQGRFIPAGDPRRSAQVAVLGPALKREIFGDRNALGEHVRIGGRRFMVIGIMEPKGRMLNFDIDDAAYIPVSSAMAIFNREELIEIDVLFSEHVSGDAVAGRIRKALTARHGGEEDFTVVTQDAMLDTLGNIIGMISMAVIAIGAISLLVGAIGILTMMWIAVNERVAEIGLVKALGGTSFQVAMVFLMEAAILSMIGGATGIAVGYGGAAIIHLFIPALPLKTPLLYAVLAIIFSLSVGLISGVLPARKAAGLDPIVALAAE